VIVAAALCLLRGTSIIRESPGSSSFARHARRVLHEPQPGQRESSVSPRRGGSRRRRAALARIIAEIVALVVLSLASFVPALHWRQQAVVNTAVVPPWL
jgi:hypothetical protein